MFKRPQLTRKPSLKGNAAGSSQSAASGAVNDEIFLRAFEETPRAEFYSIRDVNTQLQTALETIADLSKDWDRRTAAMRSLRSIIKVGDSVTGTEDFAQTLRLLETAFQTSMKDLRSLVIREACITIAYVYLVAFLLRISAANVLSLLACIFLPSSFCFRFTLLKQDNAVF